MDFSPAQIWIALAIVLIIAEFSTMSFFLLWPGIAALILALLTWFMPGMSLVLQLIIFAVLTLGLLIPGRKATKKWMNSQKPTGLNARTNRLIGENVVVTIVDGTNYRVKHGDTEWAAISDATLKKGDHAKITHVDGIMLTIKKI